jgi:glycosyltransferase involved in cell wall biosynthesis
MLARHFPPIGGAGVHRSIGYLRHLPEHGYEPVVVTGAGAGADRWSPEDRTLLDQLPPGAEIHRLSVPEPSGFDGWRARRDRWLGRSQPWAQAWVENAVQAGLALGRDADLILASCVPYETAEAGARLSAALGVPWIADLEDPWALDEMRVHATALHRRNDLKRMRRALGTASAVVMSAPEAARRVRTAIPELQHRQVVGVPIGFEPDSFDAHGPPRRDDDAFRIVHTGSLHTELGEAHRRSRRMRRLLGGSSVDVDILTRSHVFLMEAIERLEASEPTLAGHIELHLAGGLTPGDRAHAEGRRFVHDHGQLGHGDTIALMRSADLLFLPMHELAEGKRAGLIPYKTYEYLATGCPLLAAVPDGDVRDLLTQLDHASVCRPSDVAGMAAAIRQRATCPRERANHSGDSAIVREFERPRLVARIAPVFDQVVGTTSPSAANLEFALSSR